MKFGRRILGMRPIEPKTKVERRDEKKKIEIV